MSMNKSLFKKTFLASICFVYLTGTSFAADAKNNKTVRYLDPAIWNIVVDENQCFKAPPQSLFTVEPIGVPGARTYKITQYFDRDTQRALYAVPLEDQIQQRKILAGKFCGGIASISDMKLPMSKGMGIDDANDGMLLVKSARYAITDIVEQLNQMTYLASQAASGTYSSAQLAALDAEFQAHMATIQHTVNNKRFNGYTLFDGSNNSINVPVDHSMGYVSVGLADFSLGSAGLNIFGLDITSVVDSQSALAALNNITSVTQEYAKLDAADIQLKAAAKRVEVKTYVDERTDDFIVQKKSRNIKGGNV